MQSTGWQTQPVFFFPPNAASCRLPWIPGKRICYNAGMENTHARLKESKTNRYRHVSHTVASLFREGWDDGAVSVLLSRIENKTGEGVTLDEYAAIYDRAVSEARLVGSALYTAMFEASTKDAAEKALLPVRQMGGYIDEDGILQLPGALADAFPGSEPPYAYRFDPDLAPDGRFLDLYAESVTAGYPKGLSLAFAAKAAAKEAGAGQHAPAQERTDTAEAFRMIHQFRMYIDRQNLQWVRAHYPDEPNDLARLLAYDKDLQSAGKTGLYFGEPSRYHNKLHLAEVFFRQVNDKIETDDRHSEFIVDTDTGAFVSQWDILKVCPPAGDNGPVISLPADIRRDAKAQRQLLNSESFNYAVGPKHVLYDVLPASAEAGKSLDYHIKQQLKSSADWREVERSDYTEMFKKKEQVEGVVYTDIETISGTSPRANRKRKKEAKKAKAQMKENRKKARQAKVVMTENGIILATIAVLVAGAGLVIWQTIMDARKETVLEDPAEGAAE